MRNKSLFIIIIIIIIIIVLFIRDIIRNAVNASESDSVVFVGNGVTGAVHKLIHALDFKQPPVSYLMLLVQLNSAILNSLKEKQK